ncbi:DUF6188 family protein [Humibacillus sp. DSM 29435]
MRSRRALHRVGSTSRVTYAAAAEYTAWQLSGPRGEMVVCMPGR